MCQLFNYIPFVHAQQMAHEDASLILPYVVTLLCKEMMTDNDFGLFDNKHVNLRMAQLSSSYRANVHED